MFDISKFIVALGLVCAPLACTVDDGDEDTGAGTDTTGADTTATSPTTTSPTTTTTATTTTTTGETDTADTGTDTGTGTGGTADTGTDTGTGTGGEGAGICFPTCTETLDCCEAYGVLEENCTPELFPIECNAEGICEFTSTGCAVDQDCVDTGIGDTCVIEDGFGSCFYACRAAEDCDANPATEGYECVDMICTAPACEEDADCNQPGQDDFTCDVATGNCVTCTEDADCEANSNGTTCAAEGFCGCEADEECVIRGDVCVQ